MIGVDISDRSIKMVQLSESLPRQLLAHCVEFISEGAITNGQIEQPATVEKYLRKVVEQCTISSASSEAIVASISETQSFLRVVEIPDMSEEEISEAIQWEVAQHIPFGLENVYIDWQDVPARGHVTGAGKREVQVGAAQKKVVDALYDVLSTLKIDIAAFELESQAIVRALISPSLKARQGLLIVDLGASATNVVVHDHGAMRFTATLQKGVHNMAKSLPDSDAELVIYKLHVLKQDQLERLSTRLLPALEELAVEIRGIVEFYNSIDAQHEVKEIIVTGGGSNIPGLDTALLKYFEDVHIQRGNPWVNILPTSALNKPPIDMRDAVRFATALGLALRPVII